MTPTPLSPEKEKIDSVDPVAVEDISYHSSSDDCSQALTAEEEKRLWRKVDMRLIPISVLLYLMSYLDRGNIGSSPLNNHLGERTLRPHVTLQEMQSLKDSSRNWTLPANGITWRW